MPTSSFTGGNAGSGTNKNVNNVIYVQDKGNTTFDGYITINGNLTVNGTTTTIDSVTLTIEDPVITLAKNANLNPTATTDAGLFLQRGSTENPAVFIWNETLNQFELATVAGATSTTTNFTGLTKTYSTLKAGIFSGSSATFTGVVTSKGLSLTTDGQVSIKKPTLATTPAILFNSDRTGNGDEADIIALEVERGALTNAKIKWDETNDWWDFNSDVYFSENLTIGSDDTKDLTILSETTISNNLIPVYIYVKYNATSFTDNEYFYIFSTDDNGLTREVIPIKVNFSSPKLKLNQSAGYNRYIAYSASTYNNTTPPTINGIVYLNPNKTYYFHMVSDAIDLSNLDFQIYASNSILGSAPTYWKVFDGYDVNTTNAIVTYTFVRDATWKESDVVYKAGVLGGFGFIDVSDISSPTSVSDIQAKTSLKIQKGKNAILLNSDYTGNPNEDGSNVIALEVERGIDTNSYIEWDEENQRWDIEPSSFSTSFATDTLDATTTTINMLDANNITTEQIEIENNHFPVYIYVKYNSLSLGDDEYFYIFSTDDNGITRDVVRLSDLDHLSENTSAGYYRYIASASSTYNNTTPTPTVNAIAYLDPNKTYYFNMDSTDIESSGPDFYAYVSTTELGSGELPSYALVLSGFSSSTTTSANIVYTLIADAQWNGNNIVRRVDNGVVEISTMSGATTVDDIDIIPIRIHSKKDNQSNTAILLNSDETGSPTKSVQIEVERGTSTNSYIKWDEVNDIWQMSSHTKTPVLTSALSFLGDHTLGAFGATSIDGNSIIGAWGQSTTTTINSTANFNSTATFKSELYLNTDQQIKFKKPTGTSISAILFNSDETGSPTKSVSIEVERGTSPNAIIEWNETNDYWYSSNPFYISTALTVEGDATFTPDGDLTVNSSTTTFNSTNVTFTAEGEDTPDTNFYSYARFYSTAYFNSYAHFNQNAYFHDLAYFESTASFNSTTTFNSKLILGSENLIISSTGAVTVTKAYHKIDTYNNQGSYNLDTIDGGVGGMILVIQSVNDSRHVVVKDGTGNIRLSSDFTLSNTQDTLTLIYNASLSVWCELCRSNNAT